MLHRITIAVIHLFVNSEG